jgi:class 3 adenylate cyclase/tetratricopeptide (TPR) repeat protein
MQCPACNAETPERSRFCNECGAPMPKPCGSCGVLNSRTAKFCSECATPFAPAAAASAASAPAAASVAAPLVLPTAPPPSITRSERRQLTVMFADLVGSSEMSGRLDPEDLRHLLLSFQTESEAVIRKYEGHVAQLLGDGILVYFGFPKAHEDNARRAVLAGLEIVEAVQKLGASLGQKLGTTIAVRIGIHTGPTVVGAMGGGQSSEQLAIGPTPNIAARLQAFAEPNSVVISDETLRLTRGAFLYEDLGQHELKGIAYVRRIWRVLREARVTLFVEQIRSLVGTPIVGRDPELASLTQCWANAKEGLGRVVVISGEAGLGKSRLAAALVAKLASDSRVYLACRCSPFHTSSPLHPLRDMLADHWSIDAASEPAQQLAQLESGLGALGLCTPDAVELLGAFLKIPIPADRYPALALSPQVRRARTLGLLSSVLLELARYQPILVLAEDLHWVDQSTLEFLRDFSSAIGSEAVLLVLTTRSPLEFRAPGRVDLSLGPLPRASIMGIIDNLRGERAIASDLVDKILARADGNPLFTEELTHNVLEASGTIPSTLQDSLMSRLDRVSSQRKALIQLCSVLGRAFSNQLLKKVVASVEPTLTSEISNLTEGDLIYAQGEPPMGGYLFKHALLQEAAYESLPRSVKTSYHAAIAKTLKADFSEVAPEVVAHHFTAAGMAAEAVAEWHLAGQVALGAFALVDSASHLRRGLTVLEQLPNTPERLRNELSLRVTLGAPIMLMTGFASSEVKAHTEDLWRLCTEAGADAADLQFAALWFLWTVAEVSGNFPRAQEMGDRLLELAELTKLSIIMLVARTGLGGAHLMRGNLEQARIHFEEGLRVYDPKEHSQLAFLFGQDCAGMCAAFLTWVHAFDGNEAAANAAVQRSLEICAGLNQHPGTRGFVECVLASYYNLIGDYTTAAAYSQSVSKLGQEQGMPHWAAQGEINLGWAMQAQGQPDGGIPKLAGGIAGLLGIGTGASMSLFYSAQAEAELRRGAVDEALAILETATNHVVRADERCFESEVRRLKAKALLKRGGPSSKSEAEAELREAVAIATRQGATRLVQRAQAELATLEAAAVGPS